MIISIPVATKYTADPSDHKVQKQAVCRCTECSKCLLIAVEVVVWDCLGSIGHAAIINRSLRRRRILAWHFFP
eukprot:scaffold657949_cov61-Prasinocladus_malaysianus.AAC.1